MPLITEAQLIARYGDPGVKLVLPSPTWEKASIVTARDAGGDVKGMPGVPAQFYFRVHRLVEPAMRAAFAAAKAACPTYKIGRAACYVYRHQRHDSKRPLSTHSWGVAVDVDPDQNSAKTFAKASPAPWSPEWMAAWPKGLPRAFVEAFEANGFDWGGRWGSFVDPMHFQIKAPTTK